MKKNKDKNNYEDYNETLSVLPYNQLVRILCGKEKHLVITFSEYYDQFGTRKKYQFVTIKNQTDDTTKTYLAADQDPGLLEINLKKALLKIKDKIEYNYFDNSSLYIFFATVEKNSLVYPPSITKKLIKEFKEYEKKQKTLEDEYMNNDTKEPKKKLLNTLDSGNTPFDI